jgi:dCMP deaminase
MTVADTVAQRSACVRRQAGAVIVDVTNRIVATAYNGPPAGYPITCASGCPRAREGLVEDGYHQCLSVHSEAHALLFCDRRDRLGGTLYSNMTPCLDCAKLLGSSGLGRVVMRLHEADAHRDPQRSISFMQASGLEVVQWQA